MLVSTTDSNFDDYSDAADHLSICLIELLLFPWMFVDDGLLVGNSENVTECIKCNDKKNNKNLPQASEMERVTKSLSSVGSSSLQVEKMNDGR